MSSLEQFCAVTGADEKTGEHMLASCNGDLDAAVALFYEGGADAAMEDSDDGADDEAEAAAAEPAVAPVVEAAVAVSVGRRRRRCRS